MILSKDTRQKNILRSLAFNWSRLNNVLLKMSRKFYFSQVAYWVSANDYCLFTHCMAWGEKYRKTIDKITSICFISMNYAKMFARAMLLTRTFAFAQVKYAFWLLKAILKRLLHHPSMHPSIQFLNNDHKCSNFLTILISFIILFLHKCSTFLAFLRLHSQWDVS